MEDIKDSGEIPMTANADCESDIPDEIISSDGTKDSTDDKEKVTDEG